MFQLRVCWCGVRQRSLAQVSARRTHCPVETGILKAPQKYGCPIFPQELWPVCVAFHYSQVYGGGIWIHLHSGETRYKLVVTSLHRYWLFTTSFFALASIFLTHKVRDSFRWKLGSYSSRRGSNSFQQFDCCMGIPYHDLVYLAVTFQRTMQLTMLLQRIEQSRMYWAIAMIENA
jgi:hypothetical protein